VASNHYTEDQFGYGSLKILRSLNSIIVAISLARSLLPLAVLEASLVETGEGSKCKHRKRSPNDYIFGEDKVLILIRSWL